MFHLQFFHEYCNTVTHVYCAELCQLCELLHIQHHGDPSRSPVQDDELDDGMHVSTRNPSKDTIFECVTIKMSNNTDLNTRSAYAAEPRCTHCWISFAWFQTSKAAIRWLWASCTSPRLSWHFLCRIRNACKASDPGVDQKYCNSWSQRELCRCISGNCIPRFLKACSSTENFVYKFSEQHLLHQVWWGHVQDAGLLQLYEAMPCRRPNQGHSMQR
jgi:hypothetical protein